MSIPIPNYLKSIGTLENIKNDYIEISLRCLCGHHDFTLFKNECSIEEIKKQKEFEKKFTKRFAKGFEAISDKNGVVYFVKRNLFGKIIDKVLASELPELNNRIVIKVKCSNCGKEYVIFDNKYNGYEATTDETKEDNSSINFTQAKFKGTVNNAIALRLKIYNDKTLELFNERTGIDANDEIYSNAFSCIVIYGYIRELENKKIIIYQTETA